MTTHQPELPANLIERLATAKDKLPAGSDDRAAVWRAIELLRNQGAALSRPQDGWVPFSADLWYDQWFKSWPDDVRRRLSWHYLRRMYQAIVALTTRPDPVTATPTAGQGVTALGEGSMVSALEVFRICGGDVECCPNPSAQAAIDCLQDLRNCYDSALMELRPVPNPAPAAAVSERESLLAIIGEGIRNAKRHPRQQYGLNLATLIALEQALTQQRGESEPLGYTALFNAIAAATWPQTKGVGINVSVDRFRDSIGGELFTTPQPSAESLRELVRDWNQRAGRCDAEDRADRAYENCADELESLLAGGGGE